MSTLPVTTTPPSYSIDGYIEFLADAGEEKTSLTVVESTSNKPLDLTAYNKIMPPALKVSKKTSFFACL